VCVLTRVLPSVPHTLFERMRARNLLSRTLSDACVGGRQSTRWCSRRSGAMCLPAVAIRPLSRCPLSLSHTHTHTHTHTRYLSLTHTHTCPHTHARSLSLSLLLYLCHSGSFLAVPEPRARQRRRSGRCPGALSLSLIHTQTHTLARPPSVSLSLSLSFSHLSHPAEMYLQMESSCARRQCIVSEFVSRKLLA